MTQPAKIIGFSPDVAKANVIHDTAMDILQMATDVQLTLGHCDLGGSAGQVHRALSDIHHLARNMMTNGATVRGQRFGIAAQIMEGYRKDIAEQMEPLAEMLKNGMKANSNFENLRLIGMASLTLAKQVESYLALSAAVEEA